MKFPTSFKKSSIDLLPHVFQAPRDLYMTAMLMRAFEAAETITAFVGLHHVAPIDNYWIRPPEGINYTEATHTHQRITGETDE
jgi:pheromone shutdown protein TraB